MLLFRAAPSHRPWPTDFGALRLWEPDKTAPMASDTAPPRPPRRQATSTRAGDRLLARFDEVIATMRARILEEGPSYRRLPPEEIADVTELLHSNARLLVAAMAGQRVTREQLDYVAEHVRHRVRSGISLEEVLQAYRTALNAFWEECTAEVAGLGLSRDAAVDLARRVSEAMDTLTTHAAATYVREESHLRALSDQAARDLLDALLRGDVDPARAEPYNAAPGLDPQGDLVVVVGRVATKDTRLSVALDRAAAILADQLATRRASPLLVVRERAVVAIAPAETQDHHLDRLRAACAALAAETEAELYCGLSSPAAGFGAVAAAYEQASLAVSRASERRPVVALATLPAIQHLLTGATGTTRALLLAKAGPLAAQKPSALATMRDTLRGFADADLNVTRAAAALHIHENTLRYRLRRIREASGHDPQTFAGLVELLCLLEVLEDAERDSVRRGQRRRFGAQVL